MVIVEWHAQDYLHLKWHVVCRGLATPAIENYLQYCEQGLGEWGSEPNKPKCKRRGYSFSTRILTKLFELKEEVFFFFCDIKRVAGIVVLQKLEKALVHNSDVIMNVFL